MATKRDPIAAVPSPMRNAAQPPIKLFQFPRVFAIPNLSPFCCKLETWLRIAGIPYEIVETPDPRKGPKGKLPFIEDSGARIADTSIIIDHLKRTRGVDPDASLDSSQRATALLVQRTLEEHYAFVVAYTHLVRDEGVRHTRARFDAVPAVVRPLVIRMVQKQIKNLLWQQGILRHTDNDIIESGVLDWRAVLAVMSEGPFFFGGRPTTVDATVFGTLATSVLTPIESPIRDFLRSKPACVAYVERMRSHFFPELSETAHQARAS
ncbi:glutathione S-transferase family protein [Sinorhizobium chiapasense]|uniref:Glutathione S-transferase family protein n=1 Tax=Sinorhizobium chiapasense TaxID=501572 RepID=A0ABZ2BG46_9HYPH